jgi:putative N6-adenine-specific DNA methylase
MFDMVAKTLFGLEAVLAEELAVLGAGNIRVLNRAVSFTGDKRIMYKSNYFLRTGLKILVPISETELSQANDLYEYIRSIPWDKYLEVDDTLAVEVALKSDLYTHSQFVAQRIKDGVVDQFRDKYGRRPSVDLDSPNLRINAYIRNKKLILSLDSSGDPLYRRGYRFRQGPAPLNEVLAAGLVKLTEWNGKMPFIDFMCGSGTLPVEAAMIAANIPPGALGRTYGFQKWKDYDQDLFREIVNERNPVDKSGIIQIFASDISPAVVRLSISHAKNARVSELISFRTCHFKDLQPPAGPGVILINPPYGERIIPRDINQLYSQIGDCLKNSYEGYTAWIFSGNPEAFKHVGLKPSKKISLFNGQLECKMNGYSLYSGSKKQKKQTLTD